MKHKSLPLLAGALILVGWGSQASAQCVVDNVFLPEWQSAEYRKINGQQNNLDKAAWGAAKKKLIRFVDPDESRDLEIMNNLSNPRHISNVVSNQDEDIPNKKGLSDMFWLWGQFLDHDITLVHADGKEVPIPIPADDFLSTIDSSITGLTFKRSNLTANQRNHLNSITSYIDGSNIYGSDNETAKSLRSLQGGKMRISDGGLLPKYDGFFLAGDERVNEHFGLTAMHTLWVREHNRIADALTCKHPHWKDKKIYLEARRIVIATLQSITYNEFLPALLGPNALPAYRNDKSGYDDGMQANIINLFAAGAYRFGHSMLSPTLLRLNEYGEELQLGLGGEKIDGNVELRDAFFQPKKVEEAGIASIMRGFASQVAQAVDPMIVGDIRNFLIIAPGITQGFDLAALNIQRGRDHQLPGYNDVREALGLHRINSFNHGIWHKDFRGKLQQAYIRPDDLDLWVGGLAEKPHGKALVGKTLKTIFVEQFRRLRHGDRFWYENDSQLSYRDIRKFNETTLADVIRRNTSIRRIQKDVFIAKEIHNPIKMKKPAHRRGAPTPGIFNEKRRKRIIRAIRKGWLG